MGSASIDAHHDEYMEDEQKTNGVLEVSDPVPAHALTPTAVTPAEHVTPRVTTGASTGTQVDPVTELASQTAVLDTNVGDVLHSVWSPTNPTQLATAGSDALARVWKFTWSNASLAEELKSSQVDAFDRDDDVPWVVSALSWHPAGSMIAVAAYNNADIFDIDADSTRPATGSLLPQWRDPVHAVGPTANGQLQGRCAAACRHPSAIPRARASTVDLLPLGLPHGDLCRTEYPDLGRNWPHAPLRRTISRTSLGFE